MSSDNGNDGKASVLSQEETIRRLKVLSTCQTTFLKAFLQAKLQLAKSVVKKTAEVIKRRDFEDIADEINRDLEKLRLDDIVVDINSAQILMHEELALLRESLSKNSSVDGSQSDQLKSLMNENSSLRGLLKELKSELVNSSKSTSASPTEASGTIKALKAEIAALKSEASKNSQNEEFLKTIIELRNEIAVLKEEKLKYSENKGGATQNSIDVQQKNQAIKALEAEVDDLKKTIKKYESTIDELKSKLSSQAESSQASGQEVQNLKDSVANLKSQLQTVSSENESKLAAVEKAKNDEISEVTKKAAAEKEQLMQVMSQEIEELEKKHSGALAQMTKDNKKLQKSLVKYKTSSKSLSSGLVNIKKQLGELKASKKSLLTDVKLEFGNMKSSLANDLRGGLMNRLRNIDAAMNEMARKYKREMAERKKLHNLIQELKGNIRVFMRARPPTSSEIEQFGQDSICVTFPDDGQVRVLNEKGREKDWEFDEVFDFNTTQEKVYSEVSDLITSVMDGYNVCIFAYGQTGSGKTYTMTGESGPKRGVNTRALEELFAKANARSEEFKDTITVSLLEVYNEDIRDLLVSSDEKLEILRGEWGNYVPGLTSVPVTKLEDLHALLATADRNRSSGTTKMNEHSSRSHMMLTVNIISEHLQTGVVTRGKLNLVDLAGSERINKSGATGQALKEAQNINKSLSALGDVIAARANKQAHIPFRNSKLTYLLEDSLSQDSKTLMFVCVSPVTFNSEETCCSLNFAARVRSVELGKATKNLASTKASSSMSNVLSAANPSKKK